MTGLAIEIGHWQVSHRLVRPQVTQRWRQRKKMWAEKKKITTTRGWGRGESEGRFPSLSLALFSSLVFFSLSSSTSFPGFSPTGPAERERERALSLSRSVGRVGENPGNQVFSSFAPHSSIRTPETGPVARRHNCQISANQHITYVNVTKLWKTRAKGKDIIANVISANQHFASTISTQIFKFQTELKLNSR